MNMMKALTVVGAVLTTACLTYGCTRTNDRVAVALPPPGCAATEADIVEGAVYKLGSQVLTQDLSNYVVLQRRDEEPRLYVIHDSFTVIGICITKNPVDTKSPYKFRAFPCNF